MKLESYNTERELNFLKTLSADKEKSLSLDPESKSETYFYITKQQWLYLGLSCFTILIAYSWYTWGIPFTKSFEWNSKPDDLDSGTPDVKVYSTRELKDKNSWQDTLSGFTDRLNDKIGGIFGWIKIKIWNSTDRSDSDNDYKYWKNLDKQEYERWKDWLEKINKESISIQTSKSSSPELSDLEQKADKDHLFPPKKDKSIDPWASAPTSPLTKHSKDSTETITQESYDNDKDSEVGFTYPPRQRKPVKFSSLAGTPFLEEAMNL